jgi:transcriptional regulator with XRE-family HTH domain
LIHERLRQAREARGIGVDALAGAIGVRARWLEHIEAGEFGALPPGVYARSAIRAFASAMAIDPDEAVSEVAHLLMQPEDPLDGLARVKGHKRKPAAAREPEPVTGTLPASGPTEGRSAPVPFDVASRSLPGDPSVDRPRLAWASVTTDWWRPLLAATVDGLLLGAIELALIYLTVVACGTGLGPTLRVAAPAMAGLFVLIAGLYFVLLGGVHNKTLGTRVAGLRHAESPGGVLSVRAVFARACHCFSRRVPAPVEWRPDGEGIVDRWRRAARLNRV